MNGAGPVGLIRNWAGSHTYRAGRFVEARSVAEVQHEVAAATKVRVLGTRHSFNDLCDTDGTLLSTTGFPDPVVVDVPARTVTVRGGQRYAVVARAVHEAGLALPNMGSLPHISTAGAVATGTHGSGTGNQSLGAAVAALVLVGPDGTLRTVRRGEPDHLGSVVSLGALGVVVEVELDLVAPYDLRQELHLDLGWDDLLADPVGVLGLGFSTSVFTRWSGDLVGEVLVKARVPDPGADLDRAARLMGDPVAEGAGSPLLGLGDSMTLRGTDGPWIERLPHFRHDREPSQGDEIQSEWFVPLEQAGAALAALRPLGEELDPLLHASELRTVAADDLWLSPAQGRDSLALHFTWRNRPAEVAAAVERVESALAPFAPRPHWGKVFGREFTAAAAYERAEDFRALRRRVDPDGVFVNEFVQRVGLA